LFLVFLSLKTHAGPVKRKEHVHYNLQEKSGLGKL